MADHPLTDRLNAGISGTPESDRNDAVALQWGDHTLKAIAQALADADPTRFFLPPYMAHHGGLDVYVDIKPIDWDEIEEFLVDAYRPAALKRLAFRVILAANSQPVRDTSTSRRTCSPPLWLPVAMPPGSPISSPAVLTHKVLLLPSCDSRILGKYGQPRRGGGGGMTAAPRTRAQRKEHALALFNAPNADVWVASAGRDEIAHLVPLSFAWDGEHVILATEAAAPTARNIRASGRARLGFGTTRDVVMVDALLVSEVACAASESTVAARYAAQADWDPRDAAGDFVYLVLRPDRVQAWREANEIQGRTVMVKGQWLP